jgi:hypothetical protein
VSALRILVSGGGTIYLGATGAIPPWATAVALIIIAIPTHAGAVIEVVGRLIPNVGKKS